MGWDTAGHRWTMTEGPFRLLGIGLDPEQWVLGMRIQHKLDVPESSALGMKERGILS